MQTYIQISTKVAMHIYFQSSVTNIYARDIGNPTARFKRCRDELTHLCDDAGIDKGEFRERVLESLDRNFLDIQEKDELGEEKVMVPLVNTENWGLRKSAWR